MESMLERVKTALAGSHENSGGKEASLLGRMASLVRPAALGAVVLVSLAACQAVPGQYGAYGAQDGYGQPGPGPMGGFGQGGGLMGLLGGNRAPYGGGYQNYGDHLNPGDIPYAQRAANMAHRGRIGEPFEWFSPQTGNRGSYTVVDRGRGREGEECISIDTVVQLQGRAPESRVLPFCRSFRNGDWRPMSALEVKGSSLASAEPQEEPAGPRLG